MHYIELIKRVVPFFLTFAVGLVITSFIFAFLAFISPSKPEVKEVRFKNQETRIERPSYEKRRNSCKMKYYKKKKAAKRKAAE